MKARRREVRTGVVAHCAFETSTAALRRTCFWESTLYEITRHRAPSDAA